MLMENQNTFMIELVIVLKESLRKQAFSVILLVFACGGLWWMGDSDKKQLQSQIVSLNTDVKALNIDMSACIAQRSAQSVEISMLRERIDLLTIRHR